MASKKTSEGVGKKIVEALKKQSEIEITPVPVSDEKEEISTFDDITETLTEEPAEEQSSLDELDFGAGFSQSDPFSSLAEPEESPLGKPFANYSSTPSSVQDNFISDLETFEIPSNIAVLKKLITQLPSGVTRHTGAQIIKQTMEALGISMKSVLQEAQQVQDGLSNSANECYANVQEYKKQIMVLEKQAQNYQRQYTALNELISLFIQTGM